MEAAEEREIFFFVVSVETVQYPSCSSHRPVIVSLRFWSLVFHSFSLFTKTSNMGTTNVCTKFYSNPFSNKLRYWSKVTNLEPGC